MVTQVKDAHGVTTQDYIYCETCKCMADFWKYDHDISAAGHWHHRWRYVTESELAECIVECSEPFPICPECGGLLEESGIKCGCCGLDTSTLPARWANCFGECEAPS